MSYWIKLAGTAEDPLPANWYSGGRAWRERWGDASMFPRRPTVAIGDRMVYYAVGSAALFKTGRIYAVVEVTSDPHESGHSRWPWQVLTQMLVPGPRLPSCPTIDDIDVAPTSLQRQSHIGLSDEKGRAAERLILKAAERAGRIGHCYSGPPPPTDFEVEG